MTIQLSKLSFATQRKLYELDTQLIGTSDYMGICFFWDYEYRHYLRDATEKQRVKVHAAFLKAGIQVNGVSKQHFSIIKSIIK